MIRFEFEPPRQQITNDQMARIFELMVHHGWDLEYDVVAHDHEDNHDAVHLWVHSDLEDEQPTRIHIRNDGDVMLTETVDWDWKGTTRDAANELGQG